MRAEKRTQKTEERKEKKRETNVPIMALFTRLNPDETAFSVAPSKPA